MKVRLVLIAIVTGLTALLPTSYAGASSSDGSGSTTVTTSPFSGIARSCDELSEPIELSGTIRNVAHTTVSESGNAFSLFRLQLVNVTGIGLVTGDSYRFLDSYTFRDDLSGAPYAATLVIRQRVITSDQERRSDLRLLVHFTLDANGEPHADVSNFEQSCGPE
jgi:hypothetical protein